MPHAKGTYLGGIRTVADLRERCRIDETTGCWHWGLAVVHGKPKVHFTAPDTGVRTSMHGQRAAVYLRDRVAPAKGILVWRKDSCHSRDCVNPAHAVMGTPAEHGAYVRRTGMMRGLPQTIAANRRIARTKLAKLTAEQAQDIRCSDEPNAALSERYGVAQSAVSSIKRGEAWKDVMTNASVFSHRPAKEAA